MTPLFPIVGWVGDGVKRDRVTARGEVYDGT
jgi:hypothetical protein